MKNSELITTLKSMLPEGYWDIIEEYYPLYSSANEVAEALDLGAYIEGCASDEIVTFIEKTHGSHSNIVIAHLLLDVKLYILSLERLTVAKPVSSWYSHIFKQSHLTQTKT